MLPRLSSKDGEKRRKLSLYCGQKNLLPLMASVSSELGWTVNTTPDRADALWVTSQDEAKRRLARGKTGQLISKIPGFLELCSKAKLARELARAQALFPEQYSFWPENYVLPEDGPRLKELMNGHTMYIAKPNHGSQGEGIFLAASWDDLVANCEGTDYVVQKYIGTPLLVDGCKFDMRVYVLVTSVMPLRAYVCKDGLARFCATPYQAANAGNMHNVTSHLTNYSLNKRSAAFVHSDSPTGGESSKRSLASLFSKMRREGMDTARIWSSIHEVVINTLHALKPTLLDAAQAHPHEAAVREQCFHLLGFDILLDRQLHPWLLEVNSSPSLSIDAVYTVDQYTKIYNSSNNIDSDDDGFSSTNGHSENFLPLSSSRGRRQQGQSQQQQQQQSSSSSSQLLPPSRSLSSTLPRNINNNNNSSSSISGGMSSIGSGPSAASLAISAALAAALAVVVRPSTGGGVMNSANNFNASSNSGSSSGYFRGSGVGGSGGGAAAGGSDFVSRRRGQVLMATAGGGGGSFSLRRGLGSSSSSNNSNVSNNGEENLRPPSFLSRSSSASFSSTSFDSSSNCGSNSNNTNGSRSSPRICHCSDGPEGPHVHRPCPLDMTVKTLAVAGALQIARSEQLGLDPLHCESAHEPQYSCVADADFDVEVIEGTSIDILTELRTVFEDVKGPRNVANAHRLKLFATRCGLRSNLPRDKSSSSGNSVASATTTTSSSSSTMADYSNLNSNSNNINNNNNNNNGYSLTLEDVEQFVLKRGRSTGYGHPPVLSRDDFTSLAYDMARVIFADEPLCVSVRLLIARYRDSFNYSPRLVSSGRMKRKGE